MIVVEVFQDCVAPSLVERRQFQRLPVAVQTELRTKGIDVPIRAQTADISEGGCYIEMPMTLQTGTLLKITLWLGYEKLIMEGKVVTTHPQFGNGIEFVNLPIDSQKKLRRFIENPEVKLM